MKSASLWSACLLRASKDCLFVAFNKKYKNVKKTETVKIVVCCFSDVCCCVAIKLDLLVAWPRVLAKHSNVLSSFTNCAVLRH